MVEEMCDIKEKMFLFRTIHPRIDYLNDNYKVLKKIVKEMNKISHGFQDNLNDVVNIKDFVESIEPESIPEVEEFVRKHTRSVSTRLKNQKGFLDDGMHFLEKKKRDYSSQSSIKAKVQRLSLLFQAGIKTNKPSQLRNDFASSKEIIQRLNKRQIKKRNNVESHTEVGRKETIMSILNVQQNLLMSTRNRNSPRKKSEYFHKISLKSKNFNQSEPSVTIVDPNIKEVIDFTEDLKEHSDDQEED